MLAGTKPAAMFGEAIQFRDIIPEDDFAPHVAAGRILKREYYWDDKESGHSFVEIKQLRYRGTVAAHCARTA